tara:strand:- start:1171 stop:1611 length:441 start_codon:yes stop_codon:yes gene_type:complete
MKKRKVTKKRKTTNINLNKLKNLSKQNIAWIIGGVIVIIIILFLINLRSTDSEDKQTKPIEISPLELIENKENYKGKNVKLMNASIPSQAFVYISKQDNSKERLFIQPANRVYCRNFNLIGKLQEDTRTSREWIFVIDEFECIEEK